MYIRRLGPAVWSQRLIQHGALEYQHFPPDTFLALFFLSIYLSLSLSLSLFVKSSSLSLLFALIRENTRWLLGPGDRDRGEG